MNKTEKRCLIGSLTGHAVVAAALLVGVGFKRREPPIEPPVIINTIDATIIEGILARQAGNPNLTTPPAVLQQPAPAPAPEPDPLPPQPQPQPRNDPPKVEPEPEPVKPRVEPKPDEDIAPPKRDPVKVPDAIPQEKPKNKPKVEPRKIQVDTSRTVKRPVDTAADRQREQREREEAARVAAAQKARERQLAAIRNSIGQIRSSSGSGTGASDIEIPGAGSEAFANYASVVYSRFYDAWHTQSVDASDEARVEVEIVVNKDGSFVRKRIRKGSGNRSLDASVQAALDRVRSLPAFPPGAKEAQREFILNFSLKSKKLLL